MLPSSSEDVVDHSHGVAEAASLLLDAQDHRGHVGLPSQILQNREGTGRTIKWAIELPEFELQFALHHAIKSQALADFITEWTSVPDLESRWHAKEA